MDNTLIINWNDRFGKEDVVLHLGDLCFYKDEKNIQELRKKLNGIIFLVRGNQDRKIKNGNGFIIIKGHIVIHNFILSREPIETPKGIISIFMGIYIKKRAIAVSMRVLICLIIN